MRTSVDMKPGHRSALLALAERRGERDISSVLAEVIEEYLVGKRARIGQSKELLTLAGSLSPREAERLRHAVGALRKNWR